MLVYISAGSGVAEVARAVWLFKRWLQCKDYKFEVIEEQRGREKNTIQSLLFKSNDTDFLKIQGTLLWRVQSPFRPRHKRKNWYFSLQCFEASSQSEIDESQIIFQTMRSPKKGGQHVNKTNSGVRAIYPPLEIEAIAYDERSQYRNRVKAKERVVQKIALLKNQKEQEAAQERWRNGKHIERGDEILTFRGESFEKI